MVANRAIIDYAQNYQYVPSNIDPNWICVGPSNTPVNNDYRGVGQIHRIAFDPNYGISNQTVYASSGFGGLWRSEDDGYNWVNVNTDHLPMTTVADVAVCPTNGNILYIGTGLPDGGVNLTYSSNWAAINPIFTIGVYRSTDYGATWHSINEGLMDDFYTNGGVIRKMEIDKYNPDIIIMATSNGVYKTSNALSTNPEWTKIFDGFTDDDNDFRVVKYKPGSSNVMYAASNNIFKSADGGTTWASMTGPTTGLDFNSLLPFMPYRINLAVTPANSERVYASIWGLSNGATKLYLYYYNGTNWILIFSGQGSYAKEWMGLAVSPVNPDEYYFYGKQGEGLMGSKSLTVSPTVKGQYSTNTGTYADGHVLEFQPNILNNPLLFYGHHGGISVGNTSPSGVPLWEKRNNGLANLLLWSFDDSEFHKDVIVAAKQDHYCDIYRGGQWFALPGGGDSYSVKTAKSNDSLFFGSAGDNNISRHNINNVTTNSEYSLIPYDIPSAPSKTYISKTFQIKSLPNTNHDFFTYSDLYRRKLAKPIASNDDPDHLWEVDSDIGKIQPLSWKRQLTEYDFCYTQPDHQYLTNGGEVYGNNPSGYWFLPIFAKTSVGGLTNGQYYLYDAYEQRTLPGSNGTFPLISGIAVHPEDPNRVWVSLIGYDNIDMRVAYSTDGGMSWNNADSNNSLPNLPVNNIVYQYGSNDVLYIGTDAGIFYKDASMSNWERYGNFPNVRVMELKINYCQNKLRVATFGRSIWEGDLLPYINTLFFEINSDEDIVWDNDKALHTSLKIKSGGRLTVKGFLSMAADSKIIIEEGATLIVDNGIVTNKCGQTWQGIEVWGNTNASQYALPGQPCPQGKLVLQNGATIENALNAVALWKPGDYSKSGGIIVATDAVFKNNKRSVEFISYQNFNPAVPTELFGNASYFTNCTFTVDENYVIQSPFNAHITLWNVDGVSFKGNTFQNSLSETPGKGIYSIDANYQMLPLCSSQTTPCPTQSLVPNSFSGFDAAIEAANAGNWRAILVDTTRFINNGYGVKLSGSSYASVTRSVFEIGKLSTQACESNFGIGIELSDCNGYMVENNHFSLAAGNSGEGSIGIRVYYDEFNQAYLNEIYRNTFNGVNRGNLAEGKNRLDHAYRSGLVYQCNQNTDNFRDFHITDWGIAGHQGSLSLPAGNTFSNISGSLLPPRHIANYSNNHITYFYSSARDQEPFYITNTTKQSTVAFNSCPSHLGGGSGEIELMGLSAEQQSYFEEQLDASRSAYNSLSTLYNSLVDGGSTSGMIAAVDMAWPGDMWELRAGLLDASPHLSKEVLKKAADRTDVLPESIIFEVLSTNPDELKDAELMEYLQTKAEPLPDYMIEVLESLRENITYKTILQSQMAHQSQQQARAERALMHNLVHNQSSDLLGLRDQLAAAQSLPTDMQLVDVFLQEGKTSQALGLAAMLPQLYALTGDALAEHNRYMSLKQLQANLLDADRTIFELDATEKATLLDLIGQSNGLAGTQARNIMAFIGEYEYCDCPAPLDEELKTKPVSSKSVQTLLSPSVEVRPNPANNWVSFTYTLEGEQAQAVLELRDAAGKTVHQVQLSQPKGAYLWDTRELQAGTYYYSLKTANTNKNGKVVISK